VVALTRRMTRARRTMECIQVSFLISIGDE